MNLGLKNFWAKGKCFAKYDVELAKSVGLEKPKQSFIHRLATGICAVWHDNPKTFKWWREHGGDLVQKVRLEHLEEEIIDLWHYVYALRLRLKDD